MGPGWNGSIHPGWMKHKLESRLPGDRQMAEKVVVHPWPTMCQPTKAFFLSFTHSKSMACWGEAVFANHVTSI